MPSRMEHGVSIRTSNVRQQVEDVIQEDSNRSNNTQVVPGNERKRVRGPTFMPKVWATPEEDPINVLCNEFGQAIDTKTTSTLAHFMGSLARSRKYSLYKPWNKVSHAKKQILLDTLSEKFEIPPSSRDWILKSFGRNVKNWRARVKENHYDPSLSYHEQINSKPERVRASHWKKLVKYWNKEKSKRISEKIRLAGQKRRWCKLRAKKVMLKFAKS